MPEATPSPVHGPDEGVDPRSGSTLFVGAVGVIVTIVIVLALQVLYYRTTQSEAYRKVVQRGTEEVRAAREEQGQRLEGYRWIDAEQGVVAIPIERAMDLIVEEHQAH